jgi:hypothetical protein
VDQTGNPELRRDVRNRVCARNMDGSVVKIPRVDRPSVLRAVYFSLNLLGLVVTPDQIVDNVRVPHAFSDLLFMSQIPLLCAYMGSSGQRS